ncbi:LysR family transcriptional regulator [uncultured Roseobacter sp.]|uniref:LysR family transcriptional regulator n=1 Tax=uncultured Roseobacter sp. TaxID=114847 RepID=UPI002604F02F|nr:LysR family transcriptional regulator [uncultured Roseobacter sp.]
MDTQWLEDVLVLLEEGNMTRAASRRNITQPAFSRRIRGLENWIGAPILTRGTNRIDINAALAANEDEIRALAARIRALRGKIANFDPESTTVAIAAQHAPIFSTFPEMALHAKQYYPSLKFRLRAGNHHDCVSLFLRGDTSMLLCYETENTEPLPFGDTVRREIWGSDQLIPVVGGGLRYGVTSDATIASDTPAIVYPEDSYFGEVLGKAERPFGTQRFTDNPVCESAFSSGIKEMALKGLGVGWIPFSMAYREIETGEFLSLSHKLGHEPLAIALYADAREEAAVALLNIWSAKHRSGGALNTAATA